MGDRFPPEYAFERLAHLPEPWRKQASTRLPENRARIRETLERSRLEGLEQDRFGPVANLGRP